MNGLYTDAVTAIYIEVDYESGAAPYTGSELGFGHLWSLFEVNVDFLFADHPKTITIDTELTSMQNIGNLAAIDFTGADILAVASQFRDNVSTSTARTFYIVFLDGYFADSTGRRPSVLGVSIGSSEVIAMFKPVIDSTTLPKKVEQVTLVHELGHAVGLVANGIPPQDISHHDVDHGAHCAQTDCVMYWQVSSGSIVDYILDNLRSNEDVLFGSFCSYDVASSSP